LQQVSILEQGPLTLCVPMLMLQLQELRFNCISIPDIY
jgi:hypothetical protein